MLIISAPFSSSVSAVLGICKERSKMYQEYIARASEQITTQCTPSSSGVSGFAAEQAIANRRKK